MPFQKRNDDTIHRTLEDLVIDLIANPDQLFIRDTGCEALVYVTEFDQILLLECTGTFGSAEVCREALKDKLRRIKEHPR